MIISTILEILYRSGLSLRTCKLFWKESNRKLTSGLPTFLHLASNSLLWVESRLSLALWDSLLGGFESGAKTSPVSEDIFRDKKEREDWVRIKGKGNKKKKEKGIQSGTRNSRQRKFSRPRSQSQEKIGKLKNNVVSTYFESLSSNSTLEFFYSTSEFP